MKLPVNNESVKRTQKDYSLSFKLQLVEEIDQFMFIVPIGQSLNTTNLER